MGKVLSSPVARFPGTVTVTDPLTMPQIAAFERAVHAARDEISPAGIDLAFLPAVLLCVEEWNLQGVPEKPTAETFPAKPHKARRELMSWLIGAITELYKDDPDEKNG